MTITRVGGAALAAVLVSALVPATASAQGYPPGGGGPGGGYGAAGPGNPPPPPPGYIPGFPYRRGLTLGFGAGLGYMKSENVGVIECVDCEDSVSGFLDFHVGAMLNPRFALLFELWGGGQALDSFGDVVLIQTMAMGAAQYWLHPLIWIKGGVGVANLSQSCSDFDFCDEDIDNGLAVMGAVGVEVLHSRAFSIDIQARGATGTYEGIDDQIFMGMIGVGFNWYWPPQGALVVRGGGAYGGGHY